MEKTCKRCGDTKEIDDNAFRTRILPSKKPWVNTICRECEKADNRVYHKDGRRNKEQRSAYMKQWVRNNKEHVAQQGRARYERLKEANPSYYNEVNLRRTLKKYGATLDQYFGMLEEQLGACAICGLAPEETKGVSKSRLVIDHDHATGKIRALLCSPCNIGLGNFRDNPGMLRTAASYIEQHQKGGE